MYSMVQWTIHESINIKIKNTESYSWNIGFCNRKVKIVIKSSAYEVRWNDKHDAYLAFDMGDLRFDDI